MTKPSFTLGDVLEYSNGQTAIVRHVDPSNPSRAVLEYGPSDFAPCVAHDDGGTFDWTIITDDESGLASLAEAVAYLEF